MKICPKCKIGFEEGDTDCSICGRELIDVPESYYKDMSKNKNKNRKVLLFGALFVIGIIILVRNINLADIEMSNIMAASGGSMDTNQYLIYLEQSVIKYRVLGTILSMLGGLGVLINTSLSGNIQK